jgi:hypothetical protein
MLDDQSGHGRGIPGEGFMVRNPAGPRHKRAGSGQTPRQC